MFFPSAWALLLAAAVGASDSKTIDFNPDDYPRYTVGAALETEACSADGIKDVLFSSQMRWQGASRKVSARNAALITRWAAHVGDPEASARYGEMRSLSDGRTVYWAVAPDGLIPYLEMDLRPGDKFIAYFVFVGCDRGRPLLAIEDYSEPEQYDAGDEQDVVI